MLFSISRDLMLLKTCRYLMLFNTSRNLILFKTSRDLMSFHTYRDLMLLKADRDFMLFNIFDKTVTEASCILHSQLPIPSDTFFIISFFIFIVLKEKLLSLTVLC